MALKNVFCYLKVFWKLFCLYVLKNIRENVWMLICPTTVIITTFLSWHNYSLISYGKGGFRKDEGLKEQALPTSRVAVLLLALLTQSLHHAIKLVNKHMQAVSTKKTNKWKQPKKKPMNKTNKQTNHICSSELWLSIVSEARVLQNYPVGTQRVL